MLLVRLMVGAMLLLIVPAQAANTTRDRAARALIAELIECGAFFKAFGVPQKNEALTALGTEFAQRAGKASNQFNISLDELLAIQDAAVKAVSAKFTDVTQQQGDAIVDTYETMCGALRADPDARLRQLQR